jgi:hypothetical protein
VSIRNRWWFAIVVLAAGGAAYEYVRGFPRWYDGHIVVRHTDWYQLSMLMPVPYRHASVHYYYRSGAALVRHGRFANYHGNGQLQTVGYYRDGKFDGRWCDFDEKGVLQGEKIWRRGRQVGWSVYLSGALHFFREDLFVGDEKVGVQTFEGEWKTQHYVGSENVELPKRAVVSGAELCPR